MELVYLWVEEYKNIKNQEFNFSPRFRCKYEDGKLTIDEKKDYVSIFPDKINVTAIVGENGSGKSSLIQELLYIGDINQCDKPKRTCLWAYDKNTNQHEHLNYETLHKKTKVILFDEDIDSFAYNNAYTINNLTNIKDNYKRNNAVIALLGYDKYQYDLKNLTFIPTHIEITLTNQTENYQDFSNDVFHESRILPDKIEELAKFIHEELGREISNYASDKDITNYMYIKGFVYGLKEVGKKYVDIAKEVIELDFKLNIPFSEKLKNEIYTDSDLEIFLNMIDKLNQLLKEKEISDYKIIIDLSKKSNEVENIILNADRSFFDINFFKIENDDKVYFKNLSSGEQKLSLLFGKLNYVVRKIFLEDKDSFLLLLDEPDIYLHPNWQKKLISYFINFIQNNKILNQKNIHIVISSHSPFILSDLPKENVIFLEKYKEDDIEVKNDNQKIGNCKNITNETNIDTFGANIHTLLSHGFFMKDGLMGEFAKEKINDVYYFLTNEQTNIKSKEEAQNIINLIGEPLIKKQLQELYNKKYNEKSKDEIIKELEKRVEELEKSQK